MDFASWTIQLDTIDIIYTDQMNSYRIFDRVFDHKAVNHSISYIDGGVHTNGIKGFWSLLKRGINGSLHQISAKHISRHLNELMWRFNNRANDRIVETLQGDCGRGSLAFSQLTA